MKQRILNKHNELRNIVAMGQAADMNGDLLPPAAKMMEFQWDEELARGAQLYVDQCLPSFGHDWERAIPGFEDVGQNAFNNPFVDGGDEFGWEDAIQSWYDEVGNMFL